MHRVEIRRQCQGLGEPMAQMRTWLDARRVTPTLVELSFLPGKAIRFRLTFQNATEAASFAQAFGGEVLSGSEPGSSVAA